MQPKTPEEIKKLSWIVRQIADGLFPYESEAKRRFGFHFDDYVELGYLEVGQTEAYMNGIYRDIRRPVRVTPKGFELIGRK